MQKNRIIIACVLLVVALGIYGWSQRSEHSHDEAKEEAHGHAEGHEKAGHKEGDEDHNDTTQISAQAAKNAGIETAMAGAGVIRETVELTGRIALNQNTTATLKARFPGIVRSMNKGLGDKVQAGEILATVESNDSLLAYPIKAPISGVVLERNTTVGDVTGEQPLFVIADLRDVWAEIFLHPRDMPRIRPGQMVEVTSGDGELKSAAPLLSLLPVADASSQTIIGRVVLDNPNLAWRSGMAVQAHIVVAERQAAIAVKNDAIQREGNGSVVYVREGDRYEARPVQLGDRDGEWTEIKTGLNAGEEYVVKNSFVVKADIGKAGAEHEH